MAKNVTSKIKIKGMTCVSCEHRIEIGLGKLDGVESVAVDYTKGRGEVNYNPEKVNAALIEKTIEKMGYGVVKGAAASKNTNVIGIMVLLLALYMLISRFGGLDFFNVFPQAKEGMGYGVLFLIGLLTSVHCVAMCGGINISQCTANQSAGEFKNGKFANLRPSFLYNSGRVISYTIIGGIVGLAGSVFSFSPGGKGLVVMIAGVFMIIMGLNMLNVFPWLRKFNPRMPKIFAKKIYAQKRNNRPLYVGMLNGLMPCGPLQAMQIYALSTGSPIEGALSMMLFSLGTVPLMFGLGALSSILTKKFTSRMITVSAALVILLGMGMLSNGVSLTGLSLPFSGAGVASSEAVSAQVIDGTQFVTTKLSANAYEPIRVQAGIPVEWNIQAEAGDINGCNNAIIIPEYGIEKQLEPGDNIIKFTPEESGTIPFSCWMGMIKSNITVEEKE